MTDSASRHTGFEHLVVLQRYREAMGVVMEWRPAFYATRMRLIYQALVADDVRRRSTVPLRSLLKRSLASLRRRWSFSGSFPVVDVLIVYTSARPSWAPTLDAVVERMTHASRKCLVVAGASLYVAQRGADGAMEKTPVDGYDILLQFGGGAFDGLRAVGCGLMDTVITLLTLLVRDRKLLRLLGSKPALMIQTFHDQSLREVAVRRLLDQSRPSVIISNGDHTPTGATFVEEARVRRIHSIWLYAEVTHGALHPTRCDEIWVWNERMREAIAQWSARKPDLRITVTGRGENDTALAMAAASPTVEELSVRAQVENRPTLLFLSQYVSGLPFDIGPATAKAVDWLVDVARALPEWVIIYKGRPLQQGAGWGGLEVTCGMENFLVPDGDVDFARYLSWPNLRGVASLHSVGLFVAASMGKRAFRIDPYGEAPEEPILDDVCERIRSPQALIAALQCLAVNEEANPVHDPVRFPYQGRVVERMSTALLQRLDAAAESATINAETGAHS